MAEAVTTDVFDLSRFRRNEFRDQYERVSAAEGYLMQNCNRLDTQNMDGATNPIKLRCRYLEWPGVNSHGEVELWVTDADANLFDWKKHNHGTPFRSREHYPEGAVLCIDTQRVLSFHNIINHPHLLLGSLMVYGNVRNLQEAKRHIPEYHPHFIEFGAISYNDIGNSWTFGVYGKGFSETAKAEQ